MPTPSSATGSARAPTGRRRPGTATASSSPHRNISLRCDGRRSQHHLGQRGWREHPLVVRTRQRGHRQLHRYRRDRDARCREHRYRRLCPRRGEQHWVAGCERRELDLGKQPGRGRARWRGDRQLGRGKCHRHECQPHRRTTKRYRDQHRSGGRGLDQLHRRYGRWQRKSGRVQRDGWRAGLAGQLGQRDPRQLHSRQRRARHRSHRQRHHRERCRRRRRRPEQPPELPGPDGGHRRRAGNAQQHPRYDLPDRVLRQRCVRRLRQRRGWNTSR